MCQEESCLNKTLNLDEDSIAASLGLAFFTYRKVRIFTNTAATTDALTFECLLKKAESFPLG